MVLPVAFLGYGVAALAGAFVGSQVDDSIETQGGDTNPLDTFTQIPSASKILFYSASGLALYWLANKSGVLKDLGLK